MRTYRHICRPSALEHSRTHPYPATSTSSVVRCSCIGHAVYGKHRRRLAWKDQGPFDMALNVVFQFFLDSVGSCSRSILRADSYHLSRTESHQIARSCSVGCIPSILWATCPQILAPLMFIRRDNTRMKGRALVAMLPHRPPGPGLIYTTVSPGYPFSSYITLILFPRCRFRATGL